MPGRGQKELVASRQGDGRKDGENEEALQEAAGKMNGGSEFIRGGKRVGGGREGRREESGFERRGERG